MTIEVLSVAGFSLSLAGFTAALDEHSRRLEKTRWWCLALTGAVLWSSLIGEVATWSLALSCLGFLISLVAVALACYAEPDTDQEEPAWWPKFERDFEHYVRRIAEQRGTG